MRYTVAAVALPLLAAAAPQGVTSAIAPQSTAPAGCSSSHSGTFEVQVVNVTTSAKRDLYKRQDTPLVITLTDGVLTDAQGRTGYIAANRQFQFDAPAQTGAIYTSGWSLCGNDSLAIGKTAIFYQCLSGDFYNLYDESTGDQCSQIYIEAINFGSAGEASDGQVTATPASEMPDGQITAQPVTQISDGQIQATTGAPVTQITDGQIQAPTGSPVTQISDGQIQVPTGSPVTQISDGQIQVPTGAPVTQISDGQIQAPTTTGSPITQISDGQIQAPTGKPVTQISDGQIQAPTGNGTMATPSASVVPYTGAAAAAMPSAVRNSVIGLAGFLAVALL